MRRLPLTVRHVVDFAEYRPLVGDDLARPEAWDALRTGPHDAFALPPERSAWEAAAATRAEISTRAAAIDAWLNRERIASVASYGAGAAYLELTLWRLAPHRRLLLSDYGPATVQRLTSVFDDVEVCQFDLTVDAPLDADVHLFHRLDTELRLRDWRRVMRRFSEQRILFVASELIGYQRARDEMRRRRNQPHLTTAGWIRNRAAMERLWAPTHTATRLRMYDLHAWDLRPKRG
jgi:hypothetical protein